MATFAPGNTLTLTLDYDDYVTFSGSGNMTVTPYTGSVWQTYLTGNQIIGPFKTQSTTVVISCTSDGTYTQASNVVVDDVARLITSPSGGVTIQGASSYPAIIIPRRAEQYNVIPDGVALYDVTTSNNATCVIQSASGNFKSSDVGKCCAVHSRSGTAALASSRYGTIVSVQSATQCTTSLNLAPGALTSAMFVYGTDNAVPLQNAINAAIASPDKVLKLPAGIICSSAAFTATGDIVMEGAGRSYTELEWFNFDYAGTSIVVCGYGVSGALYCNGNTTGPRLYGFNVDALGISTHGINITGRAAHVSDVTSLKPAGGNGNSHAIKMGPGMMMDHCTIIGGYNCNPLATSGDAQVSHCNIYGTGSTYFGVKCSASSDIIIVDNHIWAPGSGLFNAGSIFVEAWTADMNSVLIRGNQFDTAQNQPHISIAVTAAKVLRGVTIADNSSFNNDSVTVANPWLKVTTGAGSDLRGLAVRGNTVNASWQTSTLGSHSYLIDGTGITAGTQHGAIVSGNFLDRPTTGAYNTFTPDYTAGNIRVDNAGTVTVF